MTYEVLWPTGSQSYGCDECTVGSCECIFHALDKLKRSCKKHGSATLWRDGTVVGGMTVGPLGLKGLRTMADRHMAAKEERR
jgi:hypothetical protein